MIAVVFFNTNPITFFVTFEMGWLCCCHARMCDLSNAESNPGQIRGKLSLPLCHIITLVGICVCVCGFISGFYAHDVPIRVNVHARSSASTSHCTAKPKFHYL